MIIVMLFGFSFFVRLTRAIKVDIKDQSTTGQLDNIFYEYHGSDPICRTN